MRSSDEAGSGSGAFQIALGTDARPMPWISPALYVRWQSRASSRPARALPSRASCATRRE
jgi:hypothetical protein